MISRSQKMLAYLNVGRADGYPFQAHQLFFILLSDNVAQSLAPNNITRPQIFRSKARASPCP